MLGRLLRKRKQPQENGWLDPKELKQRTLQKRAQVAETCPGGSSPGDLFHAPVAQVPKPRRLQRQNAQYFPTHSAIHLQMCREQPLSWEDSPPEFEMARHDP